MNTIFVLSMLVAVAAASMEEDKFGAACTEETKVSLPDLTEYLTDENGKNDDKATKFVLCYFKKTHVIDNDGHVDVEKAKETIQNYLKEVGVDIDQEIINCIQEKDSAEETALFIGKCVEKRKFEVMESK